MAGRLIFSIILLLPLYASIKAQETASVHWLTFEQLEDSLAVNPKKVFIVFHTDWCAYCRKMDKVVFTKPVVANLLNTDYYAVRFDAESEDTLTFGGRQLVNDQIGKSRNPLHQITQLLALRDGRFVAPTLVVLDEKFRVMERYFKYLDSKGVMAVLN
ncbi:MAG: thioredoxin family protein [Bacteroidota bacterium]